MLSDIDLFLTRYINSPAGHHPIVDNLMIVAIELMGFRSWCLVAIRWWSRIGREEERNLAVEAGLTFVAGLLIN